MSGEQKSEERKALEQLIYWAEAYSETTMCEPIAAALMAAGVTFDVEKLRTEAARLKREYQEDMARQKTAELKRVGAKT